VVTHPTTDLPTQWFNMAERTGSLAFIVLWSIAKMNIEYVVNIIQEKEEGDFGCLFGSFLKQFTTLLATRLQKNSTSYYKA
jgi:hypothetical protein